MKNMKLSKKEVLSCKELFEKIVADPELADRMLKVLGKDPAEVRAELNRGVEDFYNFYEGEVNVDTVKEKLAEATASMSILQQYNYYANLITAFSHIGAKVFNDEAWTKCLSDHQNILSAIELGLIEENDLHIADGIAQMQQIVAENIEAFAVLFVDDPDMVDLLDACLTEDVATVKAMALNSRELAVDMAAAVYIMQESGELKSLGATRYSARDIGVMTASGLEIDAARKSGNLELAKKVIRKAAITAVALAITAPFALAAGVTSWLVLEQVALIASTSFTMYLNLLSIVTLVSGAAALVIGTPIFDMAKNVFENLMAKGAKVLSTAVDAVKPMLTKLSAWVRNTVVPAALPIWERCRSFTYHKIMVPAVAFILKNRKVIIQTAGNIIQKAKAIYEKVTHKAGEVYQQGSEIVNNIVNAAQNLATEETTGENAGVEVDIHAAPPVEFEVPIEEEKNDEKSEYSTKEVVVF